MKQQRFRDKSVDLVVMNPPFGTKEAGIDMRFVEQAMRICRGNIYSMHKSTTREHIIKYCQERDYIVTVLMQVNFPLPKRFCKYHKKEVAFTQVDVLRISPTSK